MEETMRRRSLFGALAGLFLSISGASAQQLTLWHDLGDPGTKWFAEASAAFAAEHPGVSVRAISYPTDQWFGRAISAINTDTAPDLIYNNYERVIRVASQTGKIMDMTPVLAGIADKGFLGEDDLRVARYDGRMIILPVQRVQMAFGVRKSWLDKVGESFPVTIADALRVAHKFQAADPEGTGVGSVFGFGLEAAKPRDLIHMLDLFMVGAGVRHTLVDPQGQVVMDEPKHAAVLETFLKIYTSEKVLPPDTINYSFGEMYQVIEGGRVGMFRVGDWNVAKWTAQAIKGDFVVGPWPQFFDGQPGAVVIGGMRGVAVPENAPNKALAVQFASFLLSKQAQQASLNLVGSGVRKDLDVAALPAQSKPFAQPTWKLAAYDFPEASVVWYPELEAAYHRKLLGAIARPPADLKVFIAETAAEMRALAKTLSEKKG
jgi:hypothetical protein